MSTWYEQAIFYHMYPLGITGAPKINVQTDGDRPVKKAKDHNKTRSRTERKYRPACHFLARGFKRRKSKAYKSPICRPDRAKT